MTRAEYGKSANYEANRGYYLANKEKILAENRAAYRASREARLEYGRQYNVKNSERIAARRKARRPISREQKWARLLTQYGLTPAAYYELLATQKGACAICKGTDNRKLAVDHCHVTGAVRGLLCQNCNNGLGRFKDSPQLLRRAARYLAANIRSQS